MIISQDLLTYIKHIKLLSNTPAYLFSTLKDQDSILSFSNSHTTFFLLDSLNKLSKVSSKTEDQKAIIYLILIALSYKNDFEINQLLHLDFSDIEWYNYILSYLSSNTIITEVVNTFPAIPVQSPLVKEPSPITNVYNVINIGKTYNNAL